MREFIAALLVPILTTALLLYNVLAHLQFALLNPATLFVVTSALFASLCAGVLAAKGPRVVRVIILAGCVLLLLDTSFPLADLFLLHETVTDG